MYLTIYLLISVAKFLAGILTRAFNGPKPEYFKLLPMLCTNESNDFEPNLARDCAVTLAYLAQVIVPIEVIPSCLDAIEQIVDKSTSWKSKAAVLELLQVSKYIRLFVHVMYYWYNSCPPKQHKFLQIYFIFQGNCVFQHAKCSIARSMAKKSTWDGRERSYGLFSRSTSKSKPSIIRIITLRIR